MQIGFNINERFKNLIIQKKYSLITKKGDLILMRPHFNPICMFKEKLRNKII